MQIKLFQDTSKVSIENAVNKFIADKIVIDIKYNVDSTGHYICVEYEDVESSDNHACNNRAYIHGVKEVQL